MPEHLPSDQPERDRTSDGRHVRRAAVDHNGGIARRRPNLHVQLGLVALVIVVIVVASIVVSGGSSDAPPGRASDAAPTTTVRPTTSSGGIGFAPAVEGSLCRTLLPLDEAETLAGRALDQEVIEPSVGQCAWPAETGTPLGAPLFLVVKPREGPDLATVLRQVFTDDRFRLEPSDVAEQAYVVIGLDPPFVEGLEAYSDEWHVVLGNGGDPAAWPGEDEEIVERLETAMASILERIPTALG